MSRLAGLLLGVLGFQAANHAQGSGEGLGRDWAVGVASAETLPAVMHLELGAPVLATRR